MSLQATLAGLPDLGFAVYISINILVWLMLWCKVTNSNMINMDMVSNSMMAALVSVGPVVLAQLMANMTDRTKRSVFYPFHKVCS